MCPALTAGWCAHAVSTLLVTLEKPGEKKQFKRRSSLGCGMVG